jgi:hypothetical protein
MLYRRGQFNQDQLEDALKKYLPYDGQDLLSYDVEYVDEDLGEIMVANFVWLNEQWVYVDSRSK